MTLDVLVAVIEWTWTSLAVFGVLVCAWALTDGYLDRSALRTAVELARKFGLVVPNGGSQDMVGMNLRTAHASALLHAFFLLLGVFALLTPDEAFSPVIGLFGLGYIGVAATNVRALLLNQITRVRLRREAHSGLTISDVQSTTQGESDMLGETPNPEPEPKPEPPDDGDGGGSTEG